MTEDKEIIQTIRKNPEGGFRLLMTKYKEPVYWHIRRLVVSHADSQDVAQETFVRIFRCIGQYSEDHSLRAWIFRIATNEALRLIARKQNRTTLSLDETTNICLNLQAEPYVDYSNGEAVRLQRAILALPAKQQLAFNMRYYDDMSYEEIAIATESTPANVKANYHLAKERIIKYMNTND